MSKISGQLLISGQFQDKLISGQFQDNCKISGISGQLGALKVCSFGQWVAANCAALPTANAGQYATSHCKPLLLGFPCKRWYINVRTFNLYGKADLSMILNHASIS